MSATTIKEFLVGLGFQVDEGSLKKFNNGILKSGVAVTALGNVIADVGYKVGRAIGQMLNPGTYADPLDQLQKAYERTGIAADELAKYGYQASLTGSDLNTLIGSMERFSQTAGLAASGLGRGKQIFEELGINVTDSNGKLRNTTELLEEVKSKIAGLEVGQQQGLISRLGIDPSLFMMLTSDMSDVAAEYDELMKASGFSTNKAAEDAAIYNDELDKLKFAVDLIGKSVSARLFGSMSESLTRVRRIVVENMPKIIAGIEKVVRVVLYVGKVFFTVGARIFSVVSGVIGYINKLNDASNNWLYTIGLAVIAWRALNAGFLLTPIGRILALSAAIALLVEDFYVWSQGGESLINWSKWEPGITAAMDAIYELKDLLTGLFTFLFSAIDIVVSLLSGDFSRAWFAVKELVMSVIEVFSRAFGFIAKIGSAIKGFDAGTASSAPVLTPSPATQAQLGGANQNVNQQTNITVQGGADPAATGRAVAGEQNKVNADMTRNFAPRTR